MHRYSTYIEIPDKSSIKEEPTQVMHVDLDNYQIFIKKFLIKIAYYFYVFKVTMELNLKIMIEKFSNRNGIKYNFSAPRILRQNGIAGKMNRILKEMIYAILCKSNLPGRAINTSLIIH